MDTSHGFRNYKRLKFVSFTHHEKMSDKRPELSTKRRIYGKLSPGLVYSKSE